MTTASTSFSRKYSMTLRTEFSSRGTRTVPSLLIRSKTPFRKYRRHQWEGGCLRQIKSRLFGPGHSPDFQDVLKPGRRDESTLAPLPRRCIGFRWWFRG